MGIGIPNLFSSRRKKKKQEYYDEHAQLVYGTILRYQKESAAAAALLTQLFVDVLSLRGYKKVTKEKLCAMAVQRSLLEVLQPKDTVIRYDNESGISIYDTLMETDVNSLSDSELHDIIASLPTNERVFYHALVTDGIPKKEIALWTGFPPQTIGKIVANAKVLIAKSIAEKIGTKN